jgi:hypothetical protein
MLWSGAMLMPSQSCTVCILIVVYVSSVLAQVLVSHDMLGLYPRVPPSFVRQYAAIGKAVQEAFAAYAADVRKGAFPPTDTESTKNGAVPNPSYSFSLPADEVEEWKRVADNRLKARAKSASHECARRSSS